LVVTDKSPFPATGTAKIVGEADLSIFNFGTELPTTNLAWCSISSNTAVDASSLATSSKVDSCGGSYCTSFSLYNTNSAETITFKIKTIYVGGLVTHYSPSIS
jgi:hypothetical protein